MLRMVIADRRMATSCCYRRTSAVRSARPASTRRASCCYQPGAAEGGLSIAQSTCSSGTCQYPNPPSHDRSDLRPCDNGGVASQVPWSPASSARTGRPRRSRRYATFGPSGLPQKSRSPQCHQGRVSAGDLTALSGQIPSTNTQQPMTGAGLPPLRTCRLRNRPVLLVSIAQSTWSRVRAGRGPGPDYLTAIRR